MSFYESGTNKEKKYRSESQKESGFCIHRRKLCECGVVVTDKQLKQYGKCDKCHQIGK